MITAALLVDLSREPDVLANEARDRRQLMTVGSAPDGARVIVMIGDRVWYSHDAIRILHEHSARLSIEIIGPDPAVLTAWVNAVGTGRNPVLS